MSTIIGEVSIPADDDGFVLLQCPLCGEFFKVRPTDYQADDVIEVWCPSCGLKADNYFTDDVLELAEKKTENYATDLIYNEMKKWERQFKGSFISFKANRKPQPREEYPINYGIDTLEVMKYPCCKRDAKIKPIYKMCGSYCPFCGVRYEEY